MKEALGICKEFCYPNSSSVLEVSLFVSSRGQHCGCEQTSWSHRRPSLDTKSIGTLEVWWRGCGGQMNWEIGDQHIYTLTLSYLGNQEEPTV